MTRLGSRIALTIAAWVGVSWLTQSLIASVVVLFIGVVWIVAYE